jgi:hypothetical protein
MSFPIPNMKNEEQIACIFSMLAKLNINGNEKGNLTIERYKFDSLLLISK